VQEYRRPSDGPCSEQACVSNGHMTRMEGSCMTSLNIPQSSCKVFRKYLGLLILYKVASNDVADISEQALYYQAISRANNQRKMANPERLTSNK